MSIERLLLIAVGTCLGLVLGVLLYGSLLRTHWRVERHTIIDAPVAVIHPLVDSPKEWTRWVASGSTPGTEAFGGERGVGAGLRWEKGELEIIASDPEVGVRYETRLQELPPSEGSLSYSQAQGGTKVTWIDEGDYGRWPLGGYVVSRIERSVGRRCDRSLRSLTLLAERQAQGTAIVSPEP
ncbi:MAG TPA: SRPBCC family protein [Myxococcota bacterium]|nr:SRPBCC family protein [Myxococcota bacterium]